MKMDLNWYLIWRSIEEKEKIKHHRINKGEKPPLLNDNDDDNEKDNDEKQDNIIPNFVILPS